MPVPRIYTTRLAVKRGQSLQLCAAYDGWLDAKAAFFRLFHVQDLSDVTAPGGFDNPIWQESVMLQGTGPKAWNREEAGYNWPVCFALDVREDEATWPVGLYAVQVSEVASFVPANTAYFLVRPSSPTPGAKIMLCWPWSTTAAYAGLDADAAEGAFTSLYDSDKCRRGRRVSLQRPFDVFAEGEKRAYTHRLPFHLWNWLLDEGYSVDPCTSFDLDAEPDILDDYQLLISVGHDEYWSKKMRDGVESFVAGGGNVAFFSANTAWWAMRMEGDGNIMACYKSSIEDPVASSEPVLATSNWASSPANRPENLMTGVSFRRGSMLQTSTPFTIVADPALEPFLEGLAPNSTIPVNESIFVLETDAADYQIEQGQYVATGLDGTPLNFCILAVADFTKGSNLGRQGATIGYYTNVGTVFTAATTDWADRLDDPAVQTVTRNVVSILSESTPGPAWTLAPRQYPTSEWTVVQEGLYHAVAFVALFQGDLLLHQDQGPILRGDAENPAVGWTPTDLPPVPNATSLGTRLYSPYLYVTSDSGGLQYHAIDAPEDAAWVAVTPPQPGTCIAASAAARAPLFVIYEDNGEQTLYDDAPLWTRIGVLMPAMCAMTGWNTKLFAVGNEGRLYCRESTGIDLVWLPIGSAPNGKTLGLTAYFDRLMAIVEREPGNSASRALMWRMATSESGGIDPWLLFARPVQSGTPGFAYAVGPLPGNGGFWTAAGGIVQHVVATHLAQIGQGVVLLYDTTTRAGWAVKFTPDGSYQILHAYPPNAFGAWTHIVAVPSSDSGVRIPRISATQSTGMLPRNPWECCHSVQRISATQSMGMLPPSERSDAGSYA